MTGLFINRLKRPLDPCHRPPANELARAPTRLPAAHEALFIKRLVDLTSWFQRLDKARASVCVSQMKEGDDRDDEEIRHDIQCSHRIQPRRQESECERICGEENFDVDNDSDKLIVRSSKGGDVVIDNDPAQR